jgi:glycosyltransferase involved in cell wall biosynthesis
MRITVLASSYPRFPGDGTAPFVQSISEHLFQLGHEVEVVAPYDPAVRPVADQNVPVHRFRYTPVRDWHIMGHGRSLVGDMDLHPAALLLLPPFLLSEFWTTLRVARRQRAQVIHAHWVLPNGLVGAWAASRLGIPLVISLHGSDVFVARRNRAFGWVARGVFSRASEVTACSEVLRAGAVALGADPQHVHLIPWGVDPARFDPAVSPLHRSEFNLSQDDVVLTFLGRLVPKKGVDVLVRAVPALLEVQPRLHVVIGGAGPESDELRALSGELGVEGHVHLVGRIDWDRVPAFLAMGDIFVLPSVVDPAGNVDGLPTVLPEAMGMAKAIVASDVGGIGLLVEHGKTGILVPSGDVAALVDALGTLIEDAHQREALGRAARRAIEGQFTWEKVAGRIADLLEHAYREALVSRA